MLASRDAADSPAKGGDQSAACSDPPTAHWDDSHPKPLCCSCDGIIRIGQVGAEYELQTVQGCPDIRLRREQDVQSG